MEPVWFSFITLREINKNMDKTIDVSVLTDIKKELLNRKQEILDTLEDIARQDPHEADHMSSKFPEYGSKPDENAQEISDYTANSATEKVLEKTLSDIEGALKRIENGTYGICKYCGQPIAPKRLQARPVASACIKCKTELQENE
ncbi:molecular chaperone DnaK [Candidatus Falkowbacteria bacterium HGW-Falkowbacteria-2]|uniref:Molecular chaperone DnaK n=1 Tax=Candidatus Falkowbacteria bacterium HGW-Falkowbacteria-2 TaxID=2013769 RepID=A0A2N2DX15_9BACT|nr:MAG: molecular chaperone DnaK [Candidatus Falkowbacteria bacterium HGW-Falkowbacteria-2]